VPRARLKVGGACAPNYAQLFITALRVSPDGERRRNSVQGFPISGGAKVARKSSKLQLGFL
jgi:hypothetical protein